MLSTSKHIVQQGQHDFQILLAYVPDPEVWSQTAPDDRQL